MRGRCGAAMSPRHDELLDLLGQSGSETACQLPRGVAVGLSGATATAVCGCSHVIESPSGIGSAPGAKPMAGLRDVVGTETPQVLEELGCHRAGSN
jgi:hypothetical protein